MGDDAARAIPCSPVPDGPLGPGVRLDTMVTDGPNVVRVISLDRAQGLAVRSTTATGQIVGRLPTTEIARRWNARRRGERGLLPRRRCEPSHAFATVWSDVEGTRAGRRRDRFRRGGSAHLVRRHATAQHDRPSTGNGKKTAVDRVNDGAPGADEVALFTPEGRRRGRTTADVCAAHLSPVQTPQLDADGNASQLHVVTSAACGSAPPATGDDDLLVTPVGGSRAAFVSG